ncbi:hypothetical protein AALP_AA8G032300 [Arabis alpina]|uniref:Uncharacterized protein n=1 Tax=Arabis alpina TaxID=50452 RepID=A0A087G4P5_ARAAL|nr:hypothetical protein AALP_AA8G032300 [Arabis alpina]
MPPMMSVLAITDQVFLKKYVRKYEEDKELVAKLMAIFNNFTSPQRWKNLVGRIRRG